MKQSLYFQKYYAKAHHFKNSMLLILEQHQDRFSGRNIFVGLIVICCHYLTRGDFGP